MRIAAIGDLHFKAQGNEELISIIDRIEKEADLVVLAGDLTDSGLPEEMEALLGRFKAISLPVVAVLGNHDHEHDRADDLKCMMIEAGIQVLDGSTCQVGEVGFAGTKGFCGGFGERLIQPFGERMIKQFDDSLLLETPRFEEHRRRRLEEYRASGLRECRHTEGGYPRDPSDFQAMADGWMAQLSPRATRAEGRLVGAIAPHNDFARGARGYAHVYRDVVEACDADLFIILGTDHFGDTQFAATRSDFDTPLGRVRTARDVLERIEQRFVGDLFGGELQHLGEHTIEFQVVLLRHFLGGERDFEVVPLLCGGLQEEMEDGVPAGENAEVSSLIECLQEVVADGVRRTCVIASADLSHVGPNFGGRRPVTPAFLEKVEAFDRQVLEAAVALEPDRMFQLVAERKNDTNICGLCPMYVAIGAMEGASAPITVGDKAPPKTEPVECRGELLDYHQAVSPDRRQAVSFAAATFWTT